MGCDFVWCVGGSVEGEEMSKYYAIRNNEIVATGETWHEVIEITKTIKLEPGGNDTISICSFLPAGFHPQVETEEKEQKS